MLKSKSSFLLCLKYFSTPTCYLGTHLTFITPTQLSSCSFHSFFFSFCLSSLLISLLTMPAYLVTMPCWFRPGSSRRKFTVNTHTQIYEQVSHSVSPRRRLKLPVKLESPLCVKGGTLLRGEILQYSVSISQDSDAPVNMCRV